MATQATAANLVAALRRTEGKAEIVDGEIVLMSPTGYGHSRAAAALYRSLWEHERRTRKGRAFTDNTGILVDLPRRKSFSPDAAFHEGPPTGAKFLEGAPLLAAEVRSEEDYGPTAERRMSHKRVDYFAAGTKAILDVDVLREGWIKVYRSSAPDAPSVFYRGDIATVEPEMPGWTFPVDDLFD